MFTSQLSVPERVCPTFLGPSRARCSTLDQPAGGEKGRRRRGPLCREAPCVPRPPSNQWTWLAGVRTRGNLGAPRATGLTWRTAPVGETLSHTGPAAPRAGTGRKVWVTRKGKAHGRLRLCELTHETSYPAHHVVDVRLMGRFSKFSSTEKKLFSWSCTELVIRFSVASQARFL